MGLVTTSACSLLLAAVLASSLAAEQPRTGGDHSRWSKRLSEQHQDSSEWIPMPARCPNCQPNDRVSSDPDPVGSLLTPPLPDFQPIPNFLAPKQFREQQRPVAQQLVRQQNGHQQFIPPAQEFPPKFQQLPEAVPSAGTKKQVAQKASAQSSRQLVQQPNGGAQVPILQTQPLLPTEAQAQFLPSAIPDFALQQGSFPQFLAEDSRVHFNTDPNPIRNSHYQHYLGQFFQSNQPPVSVGPLAINESNASSEEEKPEVQLVYVPVEALNQRGRINIPVKSNRNILSELKSDTQLQHEPSALAAEESRQQRQSFPHFFEQPPSGLAQTPRPNPTQIPQLVLSTLKPLNTQNLDTELHQQATQQVLHGRPQPTGIPQHFENEHHIIQSLRAHPTGIPQHVQFQQPLIEKQLPLPVQGPPSTRIPQVQRQHQIQLSQQQPPVNQDHFLQFLRPIPTIASELLQQHHVQEIQSSTPRPHPTQVSQLPIADDDEFLQTEQRQPTRAPQQQHQQPSRQQHQQFNPVTDEPQLPEPQFVQTQRPRVTQQHRQPALQPASQQPTLEPQRPPQPTKTPQIENFVQRFPQQTTTTKPIPHQPPLSVYMGNVGNNAKITDVIKVLKNAKTIAVLDSVGPDSPQVFVGPSNLNPPPGYAKFELPYLSAIDSNRVERKVDKLPFFVAPLNFNPPPGYSKIPFPAPHIGSVVVSNITEREPPHAKPVDDVPTVKPTRGRFSSQYSLPADLPNINPNLPKLVNSLQDSRQGSALVNHARGPANAQSNDNTLYDTRQRGTAAPPPARIQANVQAHPNTLPDSRQTGNTIVPPTRGQPTAQPHPTRRPHQQTPVPHIQQVSHQQQAQQFQEVNQLSEAPVTIRYEPTPSPPQFDHHFSDFQQVTTPQTPHFPLAPEVQPEEQPPQQGQAQPPPTLPSLHPSQFLQEVQGIQQFGQFPPQTHLAPASLQNHKVQQTHAVNAPLEIPSFQQLPETNQVQQIHNTQQFQESIQVTQAPVVQQYQQPQEVPQQQVRVPEETEVPREELPSTPIPRIPKRRPSYRARQRTTEAPPTEDTPATTRRPHTRGRRPFPRQRITQQETEPQYEKPSTVAPQTQYQADEEPSSTTEHFSAFRYSTRAPTRSQTDTRFQNTRTSTQEDTPRRNNLPRTRVRSRERNSQRVTGQNVPSHQTQTIENRRPNLSTQIEEDTVVPPHESRRQQSVLNQNYNTERSSIEEPTTENNQFPHNNFNIPPQNTPNLDTVYQQQPGIQFQNALPVSATKQPLPEYQTIENFSPVSQTSQPDAIGYQDINIPVSSTTTQPELNQFVPQNVDFHRTRGHPQLIDEQPLRLPQFTVPVQVSTSGRTEKPELEETPRPVYVRLRGHTRGRRPQTQTSSHAQQAGAQYNQQQTSESLQKSVPQSQEIVYQNQARRPSNVVQQTQPQISRKRIQQTSSEEVQENFKNIPVKSEESEEEYGFIRPVSFPSSISHQSTTARSHENTFDANQSQESQDSVEDIGQKIPAGPGRVRPNFLQRANRRPVEEQTTTAATTVYTVRPTRRPVKQQVRITSIRGRMRRPTTPSTTSSTTEQYQEPINAAQHEISTESQFIRRRPANRFTPSVTANEVNGETNEAFATPRSSLQRYETPNRGAGVVRRPTTITEEQFIADAPSTQRYETLNRGAGALRRPAIITEEQFIADAPSTQSTFQITLLDDAPNYPPNFNPQANVQHQFQYQQVRSEDQVHHNTENVPRYYNEDPEGGAESQWATKRLPYIYSSPDGSTIALITFTTELPSSEQTVTELPFVTTKENVSNDNSTSDSEKESNVPLASEEVEQQTTVFDTESTPKTLTTEDDKTLVKDQKEIFSAQKKASDHNLDKKPPTGRRGTWVRVRKVKRPEDFLETAESQNIGAFSKNQIQAMTSKGSMMNSWPLPPPSPVFDETVFEVPKLSSAESYITVDKSVDDIVVKGSITNNGDSHGEEQTSQIEEDKTAEEKILPTTTEKNVVTDVYHNEEVTTTLYITPPPTEVIHSDKKVVEEILSFTTDFPSIETTTDRPVPNIHSEDVSSTHLSNTKTESSEETKEKEEASMNLNHIRKDKDSENTDEVQITTEVPVKSSSDEPISVTDKTVETTNSQNEENDKVTEMTTEASMQVEIEGTTELSIERIKVGNNIPQTHQDHLSIQSSVQDAIQQNTPTEGTTYKPSNLEDALNEPVTTTDVNPADIDFPEDIIRTSMRTEVSHETEICFRGRCVKTKTLDNDNLTE